MVLWQCIVDKLFKELLDKTFSTQSQTMPTRDVVTDLEKNAIRYAARFVVRKLLHKYSDKESGKAHEYVDCLESMKDDEEDDMHGHIIESIKEMD